MDMHLNLNIALTDTYEIRFRDMIVENLFESHRTDWVRNISINVVQLTCVQYVDILSGLSIFLIAPSVISSVYLHHDIKTMV